MAMSNPGQSRQKVPYRFRNALVIALFAAIFCSLAVRAAYLQVIENDYLQSQGDARYLRVQQQMPSRGMILDRFGQPLAVSTPVDSIWAHPQTALELGHSWEQLAELLDLSPRNLQELLKENRAKQFLYLRRHLAPDDAAEVLALDIPGIESVREYKRYYPAGPVTGHILGFTNIDDVGQEGLELEFNDHLTGLAGRTRVLRDRVGHVVEQVERLTPVLNGSDLTLSIDARIQYLAYRYLQAAVKKHTASSASLVALDAHNGEILAMVNAPDFNPNDRSDLKGSKFRNRAVTDVFEPGSTIKPFTVSMGITHGVVKPDTVIDTDPGHFYIGKSVIHDTRNYGAIDVSTVVVKSSNIGSAKIALMLQPEDLINVLANLGFGEMTKGALPGERTGVLPRREKWRAIEHATVSYGHGLSVTALQLARAYTALANDGRLLPISILPRDDQPEVRNGVPILPAGEGEGPVTLEAVNRLLDED
jgi:cell division protein FtsI (penicillin-binding protein 3)